MRRNYAALLIVIVISFAIIILKCGHDIETHGAVSCFIVDEASVATDISIDEPHIISTYKFHYNYLTPFHKNNGWYEYIAGLMFFSPSSFLHVPIYQVEYNGKEVEVCTHGITIPYGKAISIIGAILVLIMIYLATTQIVFKKNYLFKSTISYLGVFSTVVLLLWLLSYAYLWSVGLITIICIYGYFALPFVFFTDISGLKFFSNDNYNLIGKCFIAIIFSALYLYFVKNAINLYYNFVLLTCSLSPSLIVLLPQKYQLPSYVLLYILIIGALT